MDMTEALRRSDQNYDTLLYLSQDSREELSWWDRQMVCCNRKTILTTEPDLVIESDASNQGWGVTCQGINTGGSLDNTREVVAHKLSGTASIHPSLENILEGQTEVISPTQIGQYFCSSLHKQSGRDGVQELSCPDLRPLDVVSGAEYTHPGPTPARSTELYSRHIRIKVNKRSIRLETRSTDLSENRQMLRTTGSVLIHIEVDKPVPTLLQLVTRSICRSHRCFSEGLVNSEAEL